MGHLALYRRFRPIDFDDVVEQPHAVSALRQSVISGQVAHAYLFSGVRGTGKTTIAKIFARGINCRSPQNGNPCNECDICKSILNNTLLDVIEMDAASNNSVDNIRRICDEVMFLPSVAGYKVYIIDEVHMLSAGAFNALLKTLEEPPSHAVFLLATTEPHRIPATILSRCQRYDFRRISVGSIVERLRRIADEQNISIEDDALTVIAHTSDGALRDAISLLDQVGTASKTTVVRDDVLRLTGTVDDDFLLSMASAILKGNPASVITHTEQLIADGRDIPRFTLDLARTFRDLLVLFTCPEEKDLLPVLTRTKEKMRSLLDHTSGDKIIEVISRLSSLAGELKWTPDIKTSFEIALLSFCEKPAVSARLSASSSEDAIAGTSSSSPATSAPPATPPPPSESVPPVATASSAALAHPEEIDRPSAITPPKDSLPTEESASHAAASPQESLSPAEHALSDETTPSEESASPQESLPTRAQVSPAQAASISERPPLPEAPAELPLPSEPRPTRSIPSAVSVPLPPPPPPAESKTHPVADPPDLVEASLPKDKPPQGDSEKNETASLTSRWQEAKESWQELLEYWQDALFIIHLQLKKAAPFENEETLRIVFPDAMGNYAKNLTQTADYTTISKDIMKKMPHIQKIQLLTRTEFERETAGGGKPPDAANDKRPPWVDEMLAVAQNAGIIVEIPEKL